jgi:hypothetical protein
MKDLKTTLLIVAFLVAGSTIDVAAQNRNERSASAAAAYGYQPVKVKKPKKAKKKKPNKITKFKAVNGKNKEVKRRRRDSWAG